MIGFPIKLIRKRKTVNGTDNTSEIIVYGESQYNQYISQGYKRVEPIAPIVTPEPVIVKPFVKLEKKTEEQREAIKEATKPKRRRKKANK